MYEDMVTKTSVYGDIALAVSEIANAFRHGSVLVIKDEEHFAYLDPYPEKGAFWSYNGNEDPTFTLLSPDNEVCFVTSKDRMPLKIVKRSQILSSLTKFVKLLQENFNEDDQLTFYRTCFSQKRSAESLTDLKINANSNLLNSNMKLTIEHFKNVLSEYTNPTFAGMLNDPFQLQKQKFFMNNFLAIFNAKEMFDLNSYVWIEFKTLKFDEMLDSSDYKMYLIKTITHYIFTKWLFQASLEMRKKAARAMINLARSDFFNDFIIAANELKEMGYDIHDIYHLHSEYEVLWIKNTNFSIK